jgi:hypothetical protein
MLIIKESKMIIILLLSEGAKKCYREIHLLWTQYAVEDLLICCHHAQRDREIHIQRHVFFLGHRQ